MDARMVSRLHKGFPQSTGFALSLAVMLAASPLAAAPGPKPGSAASGGASALDMGLRLKTAITVEGDEITLGDVFDGYLSRPERVIARAPKPGQRMTLTADWLAETARTYGLDWRPTNSFDRAIVHQPGQSVTGENILSAVKAALADRGMPASYALASSVPLAPVIVAMSAAREVEVREALFDANTRTFSALVQIPPGDPQAAFIQLRGVAFPTVQVPVLKETVGKTISITADMIDFVALPEDQVRPSTVLDPNVLVGKTPKTVLRAGQPIRETQVTQVVLVEIPVFTADMGHDTRITHDHIKIVSINAASLPGDTVTSPEYMVGKRPRRGLAGGVPVRKADIAAVRQIEVPVAARDLPRGTIMTEDDITFLTMDESDLVGNMATDISEIVGQVTRLTLRSGQPVRLHSLARAVAVDRGQSVTVLWSVASINLTAQGKAMEKGGVGDVIRVVNTKSNQTVMAEIIDGRTVRIAAPDQISAR